MKKILIHGKTSIAGCLSLNLLIKFFLQLFM